MYRCFCSGVFILIKANNISNLINRYHENKLSHAFLLETNDYKQCLSDIIEFIKVINCSNEYKDKCSECSLCNLIKEGNLPSLKIVKPITSFIKKEQILEVINSFITKPVFSKFNMYIIQEAERLNSSSGNTLLKFLEEPEDNILGFFITNNKENVLSTIRSRCQIVSCFYEDSNYDIDEETLDNVKIYLLSIYKNCDDLYYNKKYSDDFKYERKDWEMFFTSMLYYFKECIENKRNDKIELVKNTSVSNIIKIISLIELLLKYIKSNVNMDLILDKFVLEMRELYE